MQTNTLRQTHGLSHTQQSDTHTESQADDRNQRPDGRQGPETIKNTSGHIASVN